MNLPHRVATQKRPTRTPEERTNSGVCTGGFKLCRLVQASFVPTYQPESNIFIYGCRYHINLYTSSNSLIYPQIIDFNVLVSCLISKVPLLNGLSFDFFGFAPRDVMA